MAARTCPRAKPIGREGGGAAGRRGAVFEVPPSRGQSPSAERAAEPREEMAARTCPRAKPIGTEGGGAAGGDGRALSASVPTCCEP
ncbi:MAG: hypothetical protein WAV20_14725 [Blastocatellia bacterium]